MNVKFLLYYGFISLFILVPLFLHFYIPKNRGIANPRCNFATSYSKQNSSVIRPVIIAHRGSRYINPENTIIAFKNAVLLGADFLEFDVRLTKDNELIILHDHDVDRTTNGTGNVRDLTLSEIKKP